MEKDYSKEIKDLLSGKKLDIPRERLDWTGYAAVMDLYRTASPEERRNIASGMEKIIKNDEDWGIVADTIHLAYTLGIKEIQPTINEVKDKIKGKVSQEWREILDRQVQIYLNSIGK